MAIVKKLASEEYVNVTIESSEAVRFTEQTLTDEQKAQARENIGVDASSNIEPAEDDIPKVFFGAALPQTKDDTVMSFRYISKTEDIKGYCKTKAQGKSSMSYPKKNQTVKLYKDVDCTEKLEVDFKNWGKQNKFCFKANWIDLTHARNVVSARLWGDVVKARTNYDSIPELLKTSPNQGAVDGFPVKVYADGIYQGRYTINIPKDAWMANMDEDLDNHCILCGENYVSGCFRAEANIDESDWTDEVHDEVPASIKNRWNDAIRFVMNSSDEEFVAGIGHYFDVPSLIDYYIFGLVSCGLDAFGKNQLYMTWDGMKWYATMYDMDSTWGLWWNGSSFVSSYYARNEYEDFKNNGGNLLYIRIEELFEEDIHARWEELKIDALSIENIINRFERFTDIAPISLVEEDYAATTASGSFTAIPQTGANNIQYIRRYVYERLEYVEGMLNSQVIPDAVIPETNLLYKMENETVFDGVSTYIDTGVSLWSSDVDFTIAFDVTPNANAQENVVFVLNEFAWPYNGINVSSHETHGHRVRVFGSTANANIYATSIPHSNTENYKMVITHTAGSGVYKVSYMFAGVITNGVINSEFKATNVTLGIGADRGGSYENLVRYFNGTMHDFRIYNQTFTNGEISAYMNK